MTRPTESQRVVVTAALTVTDPAAQATDTVPYEVAHEIDHEEHVSGPRPIATLTLIAILLLVTLAFWMMVLGIQQGRA